MNPYNAPVVSIACITYNQEQYIAKAIESFLMQKTTFPYEIIIHDDASLDNTANIIKEYAMKNPDVIFPIFQTENQYSKGINPGYKFVIPKCKGRYVAICEGDDYWTDMLKLQKQVDFLENNPDYVMVYSKVKVYIEKEKRFSKQNFGKPVSSLEELLLGNYIPTTTVLFRKEMFYSYMEEIQPERQNWRMGDFPMWLYFASVSRIKFLDDFVAVYRKLDDSASHSIDPDKDLIFQKSTHEIKLFYMRRSNLIKIERKIWEHYFSMRANKVILNNGDILKLKKEIYDCRVLSNINRILSILISNSILRRIVRFYLTKKSNTKIIS